MKPKIGILTFFDYNNYGTVLQAYALQEKLRELGYFSELIDYTPYDNRKNLIQKIKEAVFHPNKLINVLNGKIKAKKNKNKINLTLEKYNSFKEKFTVSKEKYFFVDDLKNSVNNYDTFVIGSDQTWNTYLPITTQAFFLNFVPDTKTKLSYAPSLGGKDFNKINEYNIKENLERFDAISCRDKAGSEIITKLTGKKVETVLDPTFLIDIEKWNKLSCLPSNVKDDYIVCYFLGKKKGNFNIVEKYAKENNLKLYYIYNFDTKIKSKREYLYGIGPSEYLGLIKNAKCVFTDSFHGTVFSILFKKEFYCFTKRKDVSGSDNNRIYELLGNFDLEDRYIKQYDDIKNVSTIKYNNIEKKIEEQKEKSIKFLKDSFEIHIGDNTIPQNDNRCTGCTACYNICPKKCITMKTDEEGFLFPHIDKKQCINCGRCKSVCQIFKKPKQTKVISTYAAVNKNQDIVMKSSSGGVFLSIARYVIKQGGIVCGCRLNKEFKAEHIMVKDSDQLKSLMGSKYIQSNLKEVFKKVEEKLKNKKEVLFVGTPCQVFGLKKYLNKEFDNLITIDLICHGVPSQKIFDKYINNMKYDLEKYNFRHKDNKDISDMHRLYYKYTNGKEITINNVFLDSYYYAFLNGYDYRQSCYQCDFANINRVGDITLGDFWGAKEYCNIDTENGISTILINTNKGKEYFDNVKNEFKTCQIDINDVKKKNKNLNEPVERPKIRGIIYAQLDRFGYKVISKKYFRPSNYVLLKIKSYIPVRLKRKVVKFIRRKQ